MGFATCIGCLWLNVLFQTHPWDYVPRTNMPRILGICATIHGSFCSLAWFLSNLTSIMHKHYSKIVIFICCSNITDDHAHHFTCCFDLFIGSKVGAWITFLCRSQSQKKSMIHIFFLTSLPVITAPLASYWSCRLYHRLCQTFSLKPVPLLSDSDAYSWRFFWFMQIRGRINGFCIRLLVKQLGFVNCNALSRFEYPPEV